MEFSDYIVYVDESGDHGLQSIDPTYPIFVLAFCVFEKSSYTRACVPALQELKFKYFGHDMVVLHERDVRKSLGSFKFLFDRNNRALFMSDLNDLVTKEEFTIIASVINKTDLKNQYAYPISPYNLSLVFCLERLSYFLEEVGQRGHKTHVVFESRGAREDQELELEFRRVIDEANLPFEPLFAPKKVNCSGLQLADLVARPIGRHVLQPDQPNRAYPIIATKFRRYLGRVEGAGLKIFP